MYSSLIRKVKHAIVDGQTNRVTLASEAIRSLYKERACHANVAAWVLAHPEHRAVHGWLITGSCTYALHSVVDTGTELLDITPRPGADAQQLVDFLIEDLPLEDLPPLLIDSDPGLDIADVVEPISIYLDNNVWDFLYARRIDLAEALPRDQFCIAITREAEFEIPAIPDEKTELKAFIADTIKRCEIRTDYIFGFYVDSLPADQQRYGGFGSGRWATEGELEFVRQQQMPLRLRALRKTGLYKDEADSALAMRSIHSIVLSLDTKKGPINSAYKKGGKVVFLSDFDTSGLTLAQFVLRAAGQWD